MDRAEIDAHSISDMATLRAHFGPVAELAAKKVHHRLNRHDRDFIARSPFLLMGTSDGSHRIDVSPKGDPCGFVKVLDDTTLAIPDRPGNNRIDGFANIMRHPRVGLIFLVPGFEDTLRITGRATLTRAPGLLQTMKVKDRAPTLAVVVDVEEVFLHCAKAFKRSALWDPASLQDRTEMPSLGAIIHEIALGEAPDEAQTAAADNRIAEAYRTRLY